MVDTNVPDEALFPERVGDRLRSARMKAGLDLSDVATKTRVPLRHLQAIETGDYSSLPSTTYAVGFVKAYARAVGGDEAALAQDLRVELGDVRADAHGEHQGFTEIDPARMPTKLLAWTAIGLALLVFAGFAYWRSNMVADPEPAEVAGSVETPTGPAAATQPAAAAAANPTGQVTLTAIAPVWIRVYDSSNKRLFEKEMAAGERYDVPADASDPKIRTGRAELIQVSIGGKVVAQLGPPERTVKDVGVSAAALTARPPAPAPAAPSIANSMAPASGGGTVPAPAAGSGAGTGNTIIIP